MRFKFIGLVVILCMMNIACATTFAEEPIPYEVGGNVILDSFLAIVQEETQKIATLWMDESLMNVLYDSDLVESFDMRDIENPYRYYAFYPTESFDPLFLFQQAGIPCENFSSSAINWYALWTIDMTNETGNGRAPIIYLSKAMSLLRCINIDGFTNTCYIALQPAKDSPCFITLFQEMGDGIAIVYTTAIWVDNTSAMDNLQTFEYNLNLKYGTDAFDIIEIARM